MQGERMSTLYRKILMLQKIPREPKRISVNDIHDHLAHNGYDIDVRSVQRDLNALSKHFPLVVDDHKPAGWSWLKEGPEFSLPKMDPHTAITFQIVEEFLPRFLPPSTLKEMQPHFETARKALKALPKEGYPRWKEKVRATTRAQPLLPPSIPDDLLRTVYESLLEEKQLSITYTNRAGKEMTPVVHPLALLYRDAQPTLICTMWDYQDIKTLPLSRFKSAELLDQKRKAPKGFSIKDYVASQDAAFLLSKKPVKLVARFHPEAASSVVETPLSPEQTATVDDDGWTKITATVADTRVFRSWLLSFGPRVEVLAPTRLRAALLEEMTEALTLYSA